MVNFVLELDSSYIGLPIVDPYFDLFMAIKNDKRPFIFTIDRYQTSAIANIL